MKKQTIACESHSEQETTAQHLRCSKQHPNDCTLQRRASPDTHDWRCTWFWNGMVSH